MLFENDYFVHREKLNNLGLINKNCVISGCAVSPAGGMQLNIDEGEVLINGTKVSVSAQTITLDNADATYNRVDLILIDNSGSVIVVKGSLQDADDTTKPLIAPTYDAANNVLLARVKVLASATEITTNDIDDLRVFSSTQIVLSGFVLRSPDLWKALFDDGWALEDYIGDLGTWSTKASMPTARYNLTSSPVNNKIYVIGGYYYDGSEHYLSTNEEYNPSTNSWSTKTPMPTARTGLTSSSVNNKIYVIGGNGGMQINEEYNLISANAKIYKINYSSNEVLEYDVTFTYDSNDIITSYTLTYVVTHDLNTFNFESLRDGDGYYVYVKL